MHDFFMYYHYIWIYPPWFEMISNDGLSTPIVNSWMKWIVLSSWSRLYIESVSFWISFREMLFAIVDMASKNSVFVGNCRLGTYAFLLMMLHRLWIGFKSGENEGHTMTRPFLNTSCLRCMWRGIVMHKNHFPFQWQRFGFEPRFEVLLQESNVCHWGHFYTFRNFPWANQFIANEPRPKHDAASTLLSSITRMGRNYLNSTTLKSNFTYSEAQFTRFSLCIYDLQMRTNIGFSMSCQSLQHPTPSRFWCIFDTSIVENCFTCGWRLLY